MKKIIHPIILVFVILVSLLPSCKKESSSNPTQPAPKLLGKWNLISTRYLEVLRGNTNDHTFNAHPGEYYDFNTDSTVIICNSDPDGQLAYDTGYYYKLDLTRILILRAFGPVAFDLQDFTENKLTLHYLLYQNDSNKDETWFYLKR